MAEKIIIASGKGGAGKTSLTAGVALALARKGQSVLVIDFDIGQGCIDFMLGESDESLFNWGDALKGNCRAGSALKTNSSVSYISAPLKWDDSFTVDNMKKFISGFEDSFSYILFDSPAGVTGGFSLAAQCADRAVIVSTPDEICVKSAETAANELRTLGLENIRLVINRFDKKPTVKGKYLNVDEVIDAVKVQLIGVVPEDKLVAYASSSGFSNLKACPASAAYGRIADRVCGKKVNLVLKKTKKEKPKSKVPAVILGIIFTVIILLGGIFATDCYMCTRLKEPLFSKTAVCDTNGACTSKGLFYTVNTKKENGKIVFTELKIKNKVIVTSIS